MVKLQIHKFTVFIAIVSVTIISLGIKPYSISIFYFSLSGFFLMQIGLSTWIFFFFVQKNQRELSPTVIIGDNRIGNQLYRYFLKNTFLGLKPLGLINSKAGSKNKNVIGNISEFQRLYDKNLFQDVIIALPLTEECTIKSIIRISEKNGIKLHIVPNYFGIIDSLFKVETIGHVPLLSIRSIPLDNYTNRFWKRAFDIVVSLLLIILTSPILSTIALLIFLERKGPIFYNPIRLGVHGKPFVMYKFRSMKHYDDSLNDNRSTSQNDPRITALGRFLRKYNLDELPQLFNVLKNEMSIIGPRPHRVQLNKSMQQKINSYMIRHVIKPGITGWAQVNGWRGPTMHKIQYMGRTLHDLWYIENWTFGLDLYILFLTLFGIKSRKNAF